MRHIAQMSHTFCTTRLYKCYTQPIWLDKHSAMKKEEFYVFKRWHRWQPPSSTVMLMWSALIEQQAHSHWHCHCSHHSRWQWECYCCIQNSKQRGHTTCSYCNTHWNVLMYDNISKRMSYCVSNSWYNQQKPTHLDSELELHWCMTVNESSPGLTWYRVIWTKCSHWAAWEWPLFEKSECTEWAAADQQRELNLHQQPQGWGWQHMHCKEWELCELSALRYVSWSWQLTEPSFFTMCMLLSSFL